MTLAFRMDEWMQVSLPDLPCPICPSAVLSLHHSRTVTVGRDSVVTADVVLPDGLLELVLNWTEIEQ